MLEQRGRQRHWKKKMLLTFLAHTDDREGKRADPANAMNQQGAGRKLEFEVLSARPSCQVFIACDLCKMRLDFHIRVNQLLHSW